MSGRGIQSGPETGNAAFAVALLDPDFPVPSSICGPDGEGAPRRYGVYRNNVVVGLMEALKAAFPAVRAVMGEEKFARVARNFVAFHPPKSPLLQHYGDAFAPFLRNFEPIRDVSWLADLACLERAFLDAWHSADEPCLEAADLAGVAAEETALLVFEPHPALFFIDSPHPVASLFALRGEGGEPPPDRDAAQCAMVTRPGLEVEVREIGREACCLLGLLARGETLGAAVETLLERHPEADIQGALALFLQAGAFSSARPATAIETEAGDGE